MNVLVTGGAGYIGSHTVVALAAAGHTPIIVDSLIGSHIEVLARLEELTGQKMPFYQLDVRDTAALDQVFAAHPIEAIIHFAGLKAVGESIARPLDYYRTNLDAVMSVAELATKRRVSPIIFSSSATVYGAAEHPPVAEDAPLAPANPYGHTKLMAEQILSDVAAAWPEARVMLLRYFNPIGAHESGRIGEDPARTPTNLLPLVAQVAIGRRDHLTVYGHDYPTPDGTAVRDYLHIMDLAEGHVVALTKAKPGVSIYNLGTGQGHSVLEVVAAFEAASGKTIATEMADRRAGDVAAYWADVSKAKAELGWSTTRDLDAMCADAWNWQSQNPDGYHVAKG